MPPRRRAIRSAGDLHRAWLELVDTEGPFLAVPVLKEAFPQGLEELDAAKRKRLRQAYDEWRDAQEADDSRFADLHVCTSKAKENLLTLP